MNHVGEMKETIQTRVVRIENEQGERPSVMLRCLGGGAIPPKASVTAKAIFCDQEVMVAGPDHIKVLGKGKPSVGVGDMVEINVISDPAS
jgi:hypothetical protein